MADNIWPGDEQWAVIGPHLPVIHIGPEHNDGRRGISGIMHRLREGCRWRALPGTPPIIPTVSNRKQPFSFGAGRSRLRNVIERTSCLL